MPSALPPALLRALCLTLCACAAPAADGDDADLAAGAADLAAAADLAGPGPDGAAPADGAFGAPVACGAALPGPPLKGDLVEAQPGYAAELAAIDTSGVPDPLDYSKESKIAAALINYMLGRAGGTSASRAEATAAGELGRAVLAAAAKGQGGKVDFAFLRRGLHHFYPCARPVPRDLGELRRRYGDYGRWPSHQLDCSKPKDGPRRIYEDPAQGVYVAETVVAGQVRETEVLLTGLRRDGQLDFAAYTAAGELSDRSTFATGGAALTSAAPYTCISCHLDVNAGTITRRVPTGTGAGCRM